MSTHCGPWTPCRANGGCCSRTVICCHRHSGGVRVCVAPIQSCPYAVALELVFREMVTHFMRETFLAKRSPLDEQEFGRAILGGRWSESCGFLSDSGLIIRNRALLRVNLEQAAWVNL